MHIDADFSLVDIEDVLENNNFQAAVGKTKGEASATNLNTVTVSGQIGPFATLIVGGAVDFDLDVDLHTFELDGKGHFDDLIEPKKPEFEVVLKGPGRGRIHLAARAFPKSRLSSSGTSLKLC